MPPKERKWMKTPRGRGKMKGNFKKNDKQEEKRESC